MTTSYIDELRAARLVLASLVAEVDRRDLRGVYVPDRLRAESCRAMGRVSALEAIAAGRAPGDLSAWRDFECSTLPDLAGEERWVAEGRVEALQLVTDRSVTTPATRLRPAAVALAAAPAPAG